MKSVQSVDGEEVITYDETVYPLVRLGDALNVPGETKNGDGMLVRIRNSERQVAIHCDDVRGQEEVVVKPFEGILSGIPGLSGAAVLGEGDVVTILDVATL
jgi:two-component system chemotaxis sensor kinase CheA